jgi:hypothetical protein
MADSGLSIGGVPIGLTANAGGTEVLGSAGGEPVFSITVGEDGSVTLTQFRQVDHFVEDADGDATNNSANLASLLEGRVSLTATYTIVDGDGDAATATKTIDISGAFQFEDDVPEAVADSASVQAPDALDYNVAWVLDFSGSIDSGELGVMLTAVKSAAAKIFNDPNAGDVSMTIVAFGANAVSFGPFGNLSAFETKIDAIQAARPVNAGATDFTDAIIETMSAFDPQQEPAIRYSLSVTATRTSRIAPAMPCCQRQRHPGALSK